MTAPPSLNRPPWLMAGLFATIVTLLVALPVWPGFFSYDSLLAWEQAVHGVRIGLWPPLHTYLFQLSQGAGAGPGGLLAAQVFLLVLGAVVVIRMLVPSRTLGWLLVLLFVAAQVWFPTLLGALIVQWRDVPTASFAVLALALALAGGRSRSGVLVAIAVLVACLSVGLRYNALLLVAPLLALMVWRPFLGDRAGRGVRVLVVVALATGLGLAWASTKWRLPDGMALPNPGNFGGTQLFDVIGVSACSGRVFVPAAVTGGQPVSVAQLRQAYDPRHLHHTLAPRPGAPVLVETDGGGAVADAWRQAVVGEPRCYLEHRAAVFAEQMGMMKTGVFYSTHGGIDTNGLGLALSRPDQAEQVRTYVVRNADDAWRRSWLIYVAAILLVGLSVMRDRRLAPVLGAMTAGAVAYAGILFLVAPAADARYIFPSSILALLAGLAALGVLASPVASATKGAR
jgi:hypothetical protein